LREIPACGKIIIMKRVLPGLRTGLAVVILAILFFMVMDFNSRMAEWRKLTLKRDQVAVQATGLARTQVGLQTQIAQATSPAGVLQWAYEDGHWARKGDVVVVPLPGPAESTPVPVTQEPSATPILVGNWQLWLSLFIDKSFP
jgi:hypothetical protein